MKSRNKKTEKKKMKAKAKTKTKTQNSWLRSKKKAGELLKLSNQREAKGHGRSTNKLKGRSQLESRQS